MMYRIGMSKRGAVIFLTVIFVVSITVMVHMIGVFIYPTVAPMKEATDKYSVHYAFAPAFPFFYKYYLYEPQGYDGAKAYPLVVMLHGASRHMHGGVYATSRYVQDGHPAFIVVPIAPKGFVWAQAGGGMMQAYPLAYDAMRDVSARYEIDEERLYVTGYSMGGQGTFGMAHHYPDTFAAAAPLCGLWSNALGDYEAIGQTPLQIHHGLRDRIVAYEHSEKAHQALETLNADVEFVTHDLRHRIWGTVYNDLDFWTWLHAHRR